MNDPEVEKTFLASTKTFPWRVRRGSSADAMRKDRRSLKKPLWGRRTKVGAIPRKAFQGEKKVMLIWGLGSREGGAVKAEEKGGVWERKSITGTPPQRKGGEIIVSVQMPYRKMIKKSMKKKGGGTFYLLNLPAPLTRRVCCGDN